MLIPNPIFNQEIHYVIQIYSTNKTIYKTTMTLLRGMYAVSMSPSPVMLRGFLRCHGDFPSKEGKSQRKNPRSITRGAMAYINNPYCHCQTLLTFCYYTYTIFVI